VQDLKVRTQTQPMGIEPTDVCFLSRGKSNPGNLSSDISSEHNSPSAELRTRAELDPHAFVSDLSTAIRDHSNLSIRAVTLVTFGYHTSFKAQIEKMTPCKVTVSLHGAQLTNVMWMLPGGIVVELDTTDKEYRLHHHEYRNIAHLSGQRYVRGRLLTGSGERTELLARCLKSHSSCAGVQHRKIGVDLFAPRVLELILRASTASAAQTP
jgi:hypothetical protein